MSDYMSKVKRSKLASKSGKIFRWRVASAADLEMIKKFITDKTGFVRFPREKLKG